MGLFTQNGYWWMSYTPKGRPRVRVSTGISAGLDGSKTHQKDQRGKAQTLYDDASRGLLAIKIAQATGTLPEPPAPVETFAEWAVFYTDNYVVKHRGASREREILRTLLRFFAGKRLDQIDLDTYTVAQRIRAGEVSPATVNRELTMLVTMLNTAVRHKRIPVSPLVRAPKLKIVKRPKVRMSVDEEARILATIEEPADRAMLIMGMDSLARMGDILDFRYEHDHGQSITIVDPKNGVLLEIPCSSRLRAALDAIPRGHVSGYYFWHRRVSKPEYWAGSVRQMFKRACRRAGVVYGRTLSGLTWHRATRATGASRMLDKGIPLSTVMEIGGWRGLESAEGYMTPLRESLIQAVESVNVNGAKVPPSEP